MIEFGRRYTYDELMEGIQNLLEEYPEYLTYIKAGVSHDDREIPGIRLGNAKECLIVSGGIHGRESINPVLLLRMIEEYCMMLDRKHDNTAWEVQRKLLSIYSIYFLPIMNPDGYEVALRGYESIRSPILRQSIKMMRIPHEDWKFNARGVDINRNFPCKSYTARGNMKDAASEQETKAMLEAFKAFPDSIGYIDFHSRGRIIYYYRSAMPYHYNRKGKRMAKQIQKLSDYGLGKKKEEFATKYDGGNSVNFYSENYRKLSLTVETVEDEAGFPLDAGYQEKTYQEVSRIPLAFIEEYDES